MSIRLSRRVALPVSLRVGILFLPLLLTLLALPPRLATADEGYATWYGMPFHGRLMSNGQRFDMNDPTTTASNQYPFGTWLRVTNPANGKSVTVQVRDRGKFSHALDLSYAAFAALEDPKKMRIRVSYEVVSSPAGSAFTAPAPSLAPKTPPTPVPTAAPTRTPTPQPAPQASPLPTAKPQSAGEHVVAAGETLFGIARRFGVALADLMHINDITDPDQLSIGQRLALKEDPGAERRSTPPEGPSTRSGAAPTDPALQATEHAVLE
ncbi:MAG: LysM peptidoglycan-binding domain-containing protein [Chloroflexota bacterium]|nr:MAG: LysM peptidoglycan-binding domain-containing protein [Chloroflexota bacterium]